MTSDIGADLDHEVKPTPTPGSDAAVEAGCSCPRSDNAYGAGIFGLGIGYFVTEGCPLHDVRPEADERAEAERLDRNT